jgi:hypothetical protein
MLESPLKRLNIFVEHSETPKGLQDPLTLAGTQLNHVPDMVPLYLHLVLAGHLALLMVQGSMFLGTQYPPLR